MSIFPAGITLHAWNFNYQRLLRAPGFWQGGPNVHALTLPTLCVALAYRLIAVPRTLLIVLHCACYLLSAFTMMGLYRFVRPLFPARTALLLTMACTLHPLFLVQAGLLYLEIPLLCCTVYALVFWCEHKFIAASLVAGLACFIKPQGIIPVACLAGCIACSHLPWREKVKKVLILALLPCLMILGLIISSHQGLAVGRPAFTSYVDYILHNVAFYLAHIPDVIFWLSLLIVAIVGLRKKLFLRPGEDNRYYQAVLLMGIAFIGFYLSVPLVARDIYIIPRYYLQILPFSCLGLALLMKRRLNQRAVQTILLVFVLFHLANNRGNLYPAFRGNEFSLAERSLAYRDLLKLQQESLAGLTALPAKAVVFYGLPEHYWLTYPAMGWPHAGKITGHCIYSEFPYNSGNLAFFPDRFYLLYNFEWLGGEMIRHILREVDRSPDYVYSIEKTYQRANHRIYLLCADKAEKMEEKPQRLLPIPGGGKP